MFFLFLVGLGVQLVKINRKLEFQNCYAMIIVRRFILSSYKFITMPEKLSFDYQVSPWEIQLDQTQDEYHRTIKKTMLKIVRKKHLPKVKQKRIEPNKQKKNYCLFVKNRSKEYAAHNTPAESREHESQSILKKLKQRLRTVNTDEGLYIQNRIGNSEIVYKKDQQNEKTSRSSNKVRQKLLIQSPSMNMQTRVNAKRNISKLIQNHSEIFARRQQFSPKSLERLKSNKKLILPRIQLCTIEY